MSLFFIGIATAIGARMMWTAAKEGYHGYSGFGMLLALRAYIGIVLFTGGSTYAIGLLINEHLR